MFQFWRKCNLQSLLCLKISLQQQVMLCSTIRKLSDIWIELTSLKLLRSVFLSLEAKWGMSKLRRIHLCETSLSNSHTTRPVGYLTGKGFLIAANFTAVNKMINQNVEYNLHICNNCHGTSICTQHCQFFLHFHVIDHTESFPVTILQHGW